jgi:hypothetical protein
MPVDAAILGFSSRWYGAMMGRAIEVPVAPGRVVRIVSPPYLLATKLEAFADRGAGDYLFSQDIGDIVALVDGRHELVDEVREADREAREFVRNAHQGDPTWVNSNTDRSSTTNSRRRHASLGRRTPDAVYAGEGKGEVPVAGSALVVRMPPSTWWQSLRATAKATRRNGAVIAATRRPGAPPRSGGLTLGNATWSSDDSVK